MYIPHWTKPYKALWSAQDPYSCPRFGCLKKKCRKLRSSTNKTWGLCFQIGYPIPSSGVSHSFSPVSPIKDAFFLAFRLLSGPAKPLGPSATLTTTPPSCRAQVDQNGLGFFCHKKHGMKSESMGVPEHQHFELVILRQTMFDYWRHLKANS